MDQVKRPKARLPKGRVFKAEMFLDKKNRVTADNVALFRARDWNHACAKLMVEVELAERALGEVYDRIEIVRYPKE